MSGVETSSARAFSVETRQTIFGNGQSQPYWASPGRTPLHVEFGSEASFSEAEVIEGSTSQFYEFDPQHFNAIGSRIFPEHTMKGVKHLPVIDTDGGAEVQSVKRGSKLILRAAPADQHKSYTANSLLRDVLGDHDIDLEVFPFIDKKYSTLEGNFAITGLRVGCIVLRSKKEAVFQALPSTTEHHSHAFIQQEFGDADHRTLIQELGNIGIVSEQWQELTEEAGMGIVRTPWTEKSILHKGS